MNELYNSQTNNRRSRRRWIYIIATLIILGVLMMMPGAKTARLSLVIAHDNPAEMVLTPPKDCKLEQVYLKANEHVPRTGKIVTLVVNNIKFPVADFDKLDEVKAPAEVGFENRNAPIDWNKLKGAKELTISYEDLHKDLQRYDLELVFQITGNPDKIKNWQSFVKLYSKNAPLLIKKAVPETEKSK